MVNEEINNYFNIINKAYVTKGLWWRVVPGHYWVECRIDHTLKEDIQKIEELQKQRDSYNLTPDDTSNRKYAIVYEKEE